MKLLKDGKRPIIIFYSAFMTLGFVFFLFNYIKAEREKDKTLADLSSVVTFNNYDTSFIVGKQFIDFNLEDHTGKLWRLSAMDSLLKIAIIFNINDCARCLQEYRIWNQLTKKYPPKTLTLFAICDNTIQNIIEYRYSKNIMYPILHDPRSTVKEAMGIRYTPLFLIIGRSNEVLYATIPGNQSSKQLLNRIDLLLEKSEKGAVSLYNQQKEVR